MGIIDVVCGIIAGIELYIAYVCFEKVIEDLKTKEK